MKKLLLVALGSGLWMCAGAQNSNDQKAQKVVSLRPYYQQAMMHRSEKTQALNNFYSQGTQQRRTQSQNARVLSGNPVGIGTAYNAFGVYDASTTAITCTQATTPNLIVMTHREDANLAFGSGAYTPSYSTDNGNTWDSTSIVMFKNQTSRYPNGVIYNPTGNTDPMKTYAAVAGPWTNGSATQISWVKTVYGSIRLDTANRNENIWANGQVGVTTQDNGNLSYMTSTDDGRVRVIGVDWNENGAGSAFTRFMGAVLTTGKFNGTAFTWTQQTIRPHLYDGYRGATTGSPYDSLGEFIGTPGTAWSQDGKTGYVVIFGNLDSIGAGYNYFYGTYQPIVYKSTDSGATWTMMPPYNYKNIPNLVQYLTAEGRVTNDSGVAYPLWDLIGQGQGAENDYDLVVDINNNLHIVGSIQAGFYAGPDSAFAIYSWQYPKYYIYDVYNTTAMGGWQARFVDSLTCRPSFSVSTTAPWLSNNTNQVNYGARIQTSRTIDGSKIFYTWEDDNIVDSAGILYPDIKGMGVDIQNSNHQTKVYQFTTTQDQYFLCVSDKVLVAGTSPNATYTIPCAYIGSPTNSNDGTSPVTIWYQGAVVYGDTSFLGFNEVKSPGFSVSNNYPNPFTNETQFNISLEKESTVSVDVFNVLGEKVVAAVTPSKMAPGTHMVTLGGRGMSAGIYFYRVTVNNETITHKMVIQ
jgi:hypothetical protein